MGLDFLQRFRCTDAQRGTPGWLKVKQKVGNTRPTIHPVCTGIDQRSEELWKRLEDFLQYPLGNLLDGQLRRIQLDS
jgi:hypothetical protein